MNQNNIINLSDYRKKLEDKSAKLIKSIEALEKKGNPTKVTNALFVGSTAELQKLIKNKKKEDEHGED